MKKAFTEKGTLQNPFLYIGFLGVLVIGMSCVLMTVFPSTAPWMMDGFFTPIIAFEFVQSQNEVYRFFGVSGASSPDTMITAMNLGNQLDYLYMILYTAFLFFFSLACVKTTRQPRYYTGCILSVIVLVADALENVYLLRITEKLTHFDFGKDLVFLQWFTWIKWGGISLVFLTLVPYFLAGGPYQKAVGATGILSFILSVLSCLNRSVLNEMMGLSVALMFLLMIGYCFKYKPKPWHHKNPDHNCKE